MSAVLALNRGADLRLEEVFLMDSDDACRTSGTQVDAVDSNHDYRDVTQSNWSLCSRHVVAVLATPFPSATGSNTRCRNQTHLGRDEGQYNPSNASERVKDMLVELDKDRMVQCA